MYMPVRKYLCRPKPDSIRSDHFGRLIVSMEWSSDKHMHCWGKCRSRRTTRLQADFQSNQEALCAIRGAAQLLADQVLTHQQFRDGTHQVIGVFQYTFLHLVGPEIFNSPFPAACLAAGSPRS